MYETIWCNVLFEIIISKRLIRAGSETKSPAVRTTRRTRASSVDPESLSEQNRSHPGTPIRKRVSLLMPESPVKEEDEKKNLVPYVRLDTTIAEVDEFINSGNFLKLYLTSRSIY